MNWFGDLLSLIHGWQGFALGVFFGTPAVYILARNLLNHDEQVQTFLRRRSVIFPVLTSFFVGILFVATLRIEPRSLSAEAVLPPPTAAEDVWELGLEVTDVQTGRAALQYNAATQVPFEEDVLAILLVRDASGSTYAQLGSQFLPAGTSSLQSSFTISRLEGEGDYPMVAFVQFFRNPNAEYTLPTAFRALQNSVRDLDPVARSTECSISNRVGVDGFSVAC